MSKRLLALNLLLAAAAVAFSIQLVRVLSTPRPLPQFSVPPAVQTVVSPKEESTPPRPSRAAYGVVATKNLFNPNRSEAITQPALFAPAAKPLLYGVVINGGTRIAYLQDPATKRVFGYKIGETVAGGQLELIEENRVVIRQAVGSLEVKLKDPSKPKPVAGAPRLPPGVASPFAAPPVPSVAPSVPGAPLPVPPGGSRPSSLLQLLQGAAGAPGTRPPSQ